MSLHAKAMEREVEDARKGERSRWCTKNGRAKATDRTRAYGLTTQRRLLVPAHTPARYVLCIAASTHALAVSAGMHSSRASHETEMVRPSSFTYEARSDR